MVWLPFLLCWGSFLNVVAYRLVHPVAFWQSRSMCPQCQKPLAWYDTIPLLSWVVLRGKCRHCTTNISYLYPLIELLTAIIFTVLIQQTPSRYIPAYFLFVSALMISIRTDWETMLISRAVTLWLIPIVFICAWFNWIPVTLSESIYGALFGYGILWVANYSFWFFTENRGMGEGDLELLSFIGALTGITGCWVTLFLGSFLGSLVGIIHLLVTKRRIIPFGPFLALSGISYITIKHYYLASLLWGFSSIG